MIKYAVLLMCILSLSIGQILFKISANQLKTLDSFFYLVFEPSFICAVTLYGLTTFAWIWSLQHLPLSRAYLFMSLAYVIVPVCSWLIFKETLTMKFALSSALIISGILCSVML